MENNEIRSVYVSRAAFIRKRTPFRERGFRGRGFRVAIFIIVRKQLTDNRFSLSNSKTIRRVFFFSIRRRSEIIEEDRSFRSSFA